MKPRVGLTVFTSSFMIFLTMVVLPALSSPLVTNQAHENSVDPALTYSISILISLSFNLAFLKIDNMFGCCFASALSSLLLFLLRGRSMMGSLDSDPSTTFL